MAALVSQEQFGYLVQEHAPAVYLLSYAIILNEAAAKSTLVELIAENIKHLMDGVDPTHQGIWDSEAVRISLKKRKRYEAQFTQLTDGEEFDRIIWNHLQSRPWKERILLAAHYGLSWPAERTAKLLQTNTYAVHRELQLFEQSPQRFMSITPEYSDDAAAQMQTISSVQRFFAPPTFSTQEIKEFLVQANQAVENGSLKHKPGFAAWLIILMTIVGLSLGGFLFARSLNLFNKPISSPKLTESVTPGFSEPAVMPLSKHTSPLRWYSSSEAIKQRLRESSNLWNTLFLDIQVIDYGPPGFIGAPRIYRSQIWISQPEQSIQLFGLFHQSPSSAYMWSNGRNFYLNPVTGESFSYAKIPSPETLIQKSDLRQMIFPAASRWVQDEAILRVHDTDRIAGVNALVVDYFNPFGGREARLWLDPVTGIILRSEEYGGPDLKVLLSDYVTTQFYLNQSFPPAEFISNIQDVGKPQVSSAPAQPIQPTPTPAASLEKRTALVPEPAPPELDLSTAKLTFQFANNLETSSRTSETADIPTRLFADSYFLTDTHFGLPWMLRCDRSSNGFRISFNTGSDGTSSPDDSLRWFDLRNPAVVYKPIPSIRVDEFSFSKDGNQIALIGKEDSSTLFSIYILDLPTAETYEVIQIREGRSLVWSPDEESLAFIGQLETSEEIEAVQVHIRTGLVAFQDSMPETGDIPEDWPMSNWGGIFPTSMGGLEQCTIIENEQ